jgi:hypothetical protein
MTREEEKKMYKQIKTQSELYSYHIRDYMIEDLLYKYNNENLYYHNLGLIKVKPPHSKSDDVIFRQSQHIESLYLNVGIQTHSCAGYETLEERDSRPVSRLTFLNGYSRIEALFLYLKDMLIPKDMEVLTELNNKKFCELPLSVRKVFKTQSHRIYLFNPQNCENEWQRQSILCDITQKSNGL